MPEKPSRLDDVRKLKDKIHDGIEIRDPYLQQGRRVLAHIEQRMLDRTTDFSPDNMGEFDVLPDNLLDGTFRSVKPALYLDDPRALVNPVATKYGFAAQQLEAKLNYELKENYWGEQAEYGIDNALIYGWGFWQIGFGHPWGGFPGASRQGKSGAPLIRQVLDTQNLNGNVQPSGSTAPAGTKKKPLLHNEQTVRKGRVWRMSVLPEDVVIDPAVDSLRSAAWVAKQFFVEQEQLKRMKKDGILRGDMDKIKPWHFDHGHGQHGKHARHLAGERGIRDLMRRGRKAGVKYVKLWQMWDRESGTYFVIAENDNEDQILDERRWPAPEESFPFVMLSFNPRQGRLYPKSELGTMELEAGHVNFFNTKSVQHGKKVKGITVYDEGSGIEADAIDNIMAAESGSSLGVNGDVSKMIQDLRIGSVEDIQMWLQLKESIKLNARENFGASINEFSQQSKGGTATEAAILQQSSGTRHALRLAKVHRALREVYRQSLVWERYTFAAQSDVSSQEILRLMDDRVIFRGMRGLQANGNIIELAGLTSEEVEQEYEVTIDSVSATPMSKDRIRAELMQLANIAAPLGIMDMRVFVDKWMDMGGLHVPGLITPPPNLLDAHEEHEMMALGQPVQVQPEEDKQKHLERHSAMFQEVINAVQGQQSQSLIANAIAENPQAAQALQGHIEETQAALNPGGGTKSLNDGAVDPNAAQAGVEKTGAQVANAPTGQPAGIAGTNIERLLQGRG